MGFSPKNAPPADSREDLASGGGGDSLNVKRIPMAHDFSIEGPLTGIQIDEQKWDLPPSSNRKKLGI